MDGNSVTTTALLDPATNIALGTDNLRQVLAHYAGAGVDRTGEL